MWPKRTLWKNVILPFTVSLKPVFCFYSCLPLRHHMVTIPTLLLWGEKDAFMEVEMAEVTKIYVKNYFRLTILSEASHWLQQEQPDIVNKLIWTFLKEETRKKD